MVGEVIMGKIRNIEFLQRKNLGNYEHTEMKVSIALSESDNEVVDAKEAMQFVADALNSAGVFAKEFKDPKQTELKVEVVKEVKKETPKPASTPVKEVLKSEVTKAKEEEKDEKPKSEEKPKEAKKTVETKAAKKINKATLYDRELDTHKEIISVFLDSKYPKWKVPSNLKKAGAASKSLVGTNFLDENGDLLSSFTDAFSLVMDAP